MSIFSDLHHIAELTEEVKKMREATEDLTKVVKELNKNTATLTKVMQEHKKDKSC